eukprot:CAMPEP_0205833904 /NCGR_PEP_ID=MMETSP0206-20130828/50367_1 /ASSEMBLY_ACC=CAM_ASM_000279 /TAXON_ID=36767 /ORGANISM="Euplotes focardii, Strain TN1" /LENGTH=112 /DNA_ID=CAMNT_0053140661 /DNA_START=855 /DNA_END=1190 /DNA_ORIENTATION=+
MIDPDPSTRAIFEEITEHKWVIASKIDEDDLLASMKLRHKVVLQHLESQDFDADKDSLFHNFKIPNDNDVKHIPKRSFKKGFQLKKYSEYFKYTTGNALLSAIISFCENQGW